MPPHSWCHLGAIAGTAETYSEAVKSSFINDTQCYGNETRLFDCPVNMQNLTCTTFSDAEIACQGNCRTILLHGNLHK